MSHLVIFKSAEGKQAYHQAATLDEAVRFLEHLRNVERVEQAKLFRLTEVPVEFKTYFRAELPGAGEPAPPPVEAEVEEHQDEPEAAAEEPSSPTPASNGKRSLLKR
ncbi:MAG: hypothetical protein AAFZ07_10820 [Actinomycetota bacterium]